MSKPKLMIDYLGCQQAMCPSCPYLQVCPLHDRIEALAWLAEVYEALWWHMIRWNKIVSACRDIAERFPGGEVAWGRREAGMRRRWQDANYELRRSRVHAILSVDGEPD